MKTTHAATPAPSTSHTDIHTLRSTNCGRAGMLGILIATVLAFLVPAAQAAPMLHGTYATPTRNGTITFVGLRAFRGGVEGRFVIDGKVSPGSTYGATTGGTGMVWYYGTSGIMAGNGVVTLQANGTYAGPIWFFDRKGNPTDTGTAVITFP